MPKVQRHIYSTCRILLEPNPTLLEEKFTNLANLINDYGGKVHGSREFCAGLIVFFDLPSLHVEEFLNEENLGKSE